jgi:hypothetical protein
MWMNFVTAVLLQFVAQRFLGVWGAAAAGLFTGVIFRRGGAVRAGALSAMLAAAVLLAAAAERGVALTDFAATIGQNFSLPGWAVLVATFVLPALQAGGCAGLVSRLLTKDHVAVR